LQVGLSGKGALTEEEYNDNLIKRAKINFRPGKVLAGALDTLSFSKVPGSRGRRQFRIRRINSNLKLITYE
jgi:hypothetical protein